MLFIVDNAAPNDGIVQGNCAPSLTDLGGRQGRRMRIITVTFVSLFDQFGSVNQENLPKDFVWETLDGSVVADMSIYFGHTVSVDTSI